MRQPLYTPAEYLALERDAPTKSEYINGQIYGMSGASRRHNLIGGNVFREISNRLRGRGCETYIADMRLKVSVTGMYTYPDVIVVCGEPQFEDAHVDTLVNPTVIVEVLSPSTEACDRGEKFAHYRRLGSLMEYVLITQDKVRVEHYVRQGDDWLFSEVSELDGMLRLASIDCAVVLRDIYENVSFEDDTPGQPTARVPRQAL
ncbi:MAG: Uma2 family endonuclease [Anaerolineae bacterium]